MHIPFTQLIVPLTAPVFIAAPGINDPDFKAAALNTHNNDRAKHGVPALAWDNTLAQWAQKEANKCEFKHFGGPYGENLAGLWTTAAVDYNKQTASSIHEGWYNEIKKYDFNKPGFSMGTGHFTQVVWKSTKKVGCAWNQNPCKSNGMNFYKLVCEYDPPGNFQGRFPENVPRPVRKFGGEEEEVEEGFEAQVEGTTDEEMEVEGQFVVQIEL